MTIEELELDEEWFPDNEPYIFSRDREVEFLLDENAKKKFEKDLKEE